MCNSKKIVPVSLPLRMGRGILAPEIIIKYDPYPALPALRDNSSLSRNIREVTRGLCTWSFIAM